MKMVQTRTICSVVYWWNKKNICTRIQKQDDGNGGNHKITQARGASEGAGGATEGAESASEEAESALEGAERA